VVQYTMPNQPGTPSRTFRLSDEAMAVLDEATRTFGGTTRSETLRNILTALTGAASDPTAESLAPFRVAAEAATARARESVPVFRAAAEDAAARARESMSGFRTASGGGAAHPSEEEPSVWAAAEAEATRAREPAPSSDAAPASKAAADAAVARAEEEAARIQERFEEMAAEQRRRVAELAAGLPAFVLAERKQVIEEVVATLRGLDADPEIVRHVADLADRAEG
jgi:hypothetical protein